MKELTPAQAAAKRLMEREFERIGNRYHAHIEEHFELAAERQDLEELWRTGGFGEPPAFEPSIRFVRTA